MGTDLITVKDVQEKSKDGSTWLELVDNNNRTHRIFRRVQDNEGNWHDLSGKYDMIRNSENHTLRLTTEQKGRFVNVLDVEMAEDIREEQAHKVGEDKEEKRRLKTFTTAYAKDLAVAGKISTESILTWSGIFYRYLQGQIEVSESDLAGILDKARKEESPVSARTSRRAVAVPVR